MHNNNNNNNNGSYTWEDTEMFDNFLSSNNVKNY